MTTLLDSQYLAVGKNGAYASDGDYQSSPEQLSQTITYLKENDIKELTIYFHGGLVSENSGASSIKRVIDAANASSISNHHTMGFVWKTDLMVTLRDNITDSFNTKFGKTLLKWAIRAVTKRIKSPSTKSAGSSDGISLDDIEKEWEDATRQKRKPFDGVEAQIVNKTKSAFVDDIEENDEELLAIIQLELEECYSEDPNPLETWGDIPGKVKVSDELNEAFSANEPRVKGAKGLFSTYKIAKAIVKIAARVIKRYIKDTDHGLQATVVEEVCRTYYLSDIGQWVWGEMKEKADEMWQQQGKVGFDFIQKLQGALPDIRLNLVGHSAGSVCVSHLMDRIRQEQWQIDVNKIVWWAPACTCELFEKDIINHQDDFKAFRMYTMTDSYELDDNLVNSVPWLYPSSLLYFISGVLESKADYPIAGMERYHSAEKPYTSDMFNNIKSFLSTQDRRILSKTDDSAAEGYQSHAIDHGAFDEDHPTLKSLTKFLSV